MLQLLVLRQDESAPLGIHSPFHSTWLTVARMSRCRHNCGQGDGGFLQRLQGEVRCGLGLHGSQLH
jgi:hypothetical protein